MHGLECERVEGTASAVRKRRKASAGRCRQGRLALKLDLTEYRIQIFLRWKRKYGTDIMYFYVCGEKWGNREQKQPRVRRDVCVLKRRPDFERVPDLNTEVTTCI